MIRSENNGKKRSQAGPDGRIFFFFLLNKSPQGFPCSSSMSGLKITVIDKSGRDIDQKHILIHQEKWHIASLNFA